MDYKPLDIEKLEQLTFERSKTWSRILQDFANRDEEEDYDMADFEQLFDEDESELSIYPHADEAEIVDEPQEVITRNELQLMPTRHDNINIDENDEFQNMLNHTIPVLAEQQRKWKAAGLERILNTFDIEKIEETVGDWIRLNHSHNNSTLVFRQTIPDLDISRCRIGHCKHGEDSEYSDNESMHSIESERYIRSSRKKNGQHRSTSASRTKMTIIKTYHTIRSDHCNHLSRSHNRRRQTTSKQNWQSSPYNTVKWKSEDLTLNSQSAQRRKKLMMFRSIPSENSSSSNESELGAAGCNRFLHHAISPTYCPSMHSGRSCQRDNIKPLCCSKLSTLRHKDRRKRILSRDRSFDSEELPYKREEDCSCCHAGKLCKNVRHLVNSSTEEWLVENCDSPKKNEQLQEFSTRNLFDSLQPHHSKSKVLKNSVRESAFVNHKNTTGNIKHVTFKMKDSEKKNTEIYPNSAEKSKNEGKLMKLEDIENKNCENRNPNKKNNVKMKRASKLDYPATKKIDIEEKDSYNNKNNDGSGTLAQVTKIYKQKLKKAESHETEYLTGAKKKQKQKYLSDTRDSFVESKPQKPKIGPKSKKQIDKKLEDFPDTSFDIELQRAIKESMKQYKLEKDRKKSNCNNNRESKSVDQNLCNESNKTHQSRKSRNKQVAPNTTFAGTTKSEVSFFATDSKSSVCNSTAVANMTAISREQKRQKPIVLDSSSPSNSSYEIGGKTIVKAATSTKTTNQITEDNDCTIVTSTTGSDVLQSESVITQQRSKQTNSEASRGILIYTPNERSLAPSESFKNGTFNITAEYLGTFIGEKRARKFCQLYIGRRHFDVNSTIYYRPPKTSSTLNEAKESSTDDDSDIDVFDNVDVGALYESK